MARTTDEKVRAVIQTDGLVDLDPFIENANIIVSNMIAQAATLGKTASSDTWVVVETYVAAHLYHLKFPKSQSERVGKASKSFQGDTDTSWWWDMAIKLSPLESDKTVAVHFLGTELEQ